MKAQASQRVPKFRIHKATQQAYVELSGKRFYLGFHEAPEAKRKYHAMVAEWMANGRQLRVAQDQITVKELIARYWLHAERYYRNSEGQLSRELDNIRDALRQVKELYGMARAVEFGPRALRTIRQKMIEAKLCRRNINCRISRIRRVFKWAASEELIPGEAFHALLAVDGLRRGRCEAKESKPVRPAAQEHIDAIRPFVSQQVWAMVQLQLLTAARSGEIATLRPVEIDMGGRIWVYAPASHKTAHHGHERRVYIGPRGQAVLRPFLKRRVDAYCFSPAEADQARRADLHSIRKTPMSCGNRPGTNRSQRPKRTPGKMYRVSVYRRAIERACKRAGVPSWHPHQLRHNAATFLRKEFGLETARIILGHRSAAITTIYAEADQQKAIEAMGRAG
ncbi:MAG TPA: site-specific integrase [Phycisphaerae bacterium]|nr:site-specific integrase [Phycisphaerae bacterium]